MCARPGLIPVLLGATALWIGAGCVFKDGAADPYRCPCGDGLVCVDGICVPAGDGGPDGTAPDGPLPDGPGPDGTAPADAQNDGQRDAPKQQDAAPGCTFDPLTADAGTFAAVLTSTSWQFSAAGYAQTITDDLHTSWIAGSGGDQVSIQAVVTPIAQGRPLFSNPNGNFASLAGVMVRASSLSATSETGYFCGVDLRGQRLLLGRMAGAYSPSHGTFTILDEQAMTVNVNTGYLLKAQAQGGAISCTSELIQVNATDPTIATGSVGFYTLGARARFNDAMYCLP